MPRVRPIPTQNPRPKASLWRQAALGFVLASALPAHGVDGGLLPVPVLAPEVPAPVVHLSDEGDRVLKGDLKPEADRRSRANALYAQAMLLMEGVASANDQERALQLFRQVVVLDPAFSDAQLKLANILLQTGQLDQAYQQLQTLLKTHPDSVPVQVELGYTQKLRGQNEDAQRICAKALAADCSQTLAMRVMLEISSQQDDLAGGVVHVEDILKAGGAEVPAAAWLNLDRLYREYAHAQMTSPTSDAVLRTRLPILKAAVEKVPSDADTWTELAKIYRFLGRKIDALTALQRASSLNLNDADLVSHCAELELELDHKAEAIRDYEKAYALDPNLQVSAEGIEPRPLRDLLGELYLDNKRYEAATVLYEKALAATPGDPGLEIDLGIAYEATDHPDKAQACFQAVFNSLSCPSDAYFELAIFQLDHNEIKQADRRSPPPRNIFRSRRGSASTRRCSRGAQRITTRRWPTSSRRARWRLETRRASSKMNFISRMR